jgi:hypothetical protein
MTSIATAAIAHRSHASVLAASAMGGGFEIRPTSLRIAQGLSHSEPRTPKGSRPRQSAER